VNAELEKILVERFPSFFVDYGKNSHESCMAWGCAHGDGWFSIIEALCKSIERIIKRRKNKDFKFTQIKEKFGILRVYTEGSDDFIAGAIMMAEEMSAITCEVTGKPGCLCKKEFWVRTLCKEQAEKDGFRFL
jgi:hypothetical protein